MRNRSFHIAFRTLITLFLGIILVVTARWGLFAPGAIITANPGRILAVIGSMMGLLALLLLYRIAIRLETGIRTHNTWEPILPPVPPRPRHQPKSSYDPVMDPFGLNRPRRK